MTLLDLMVRRQPIVRERYELLVAHVRADRHCGRAVPSAWLADWCQAHSLPFVTADIAIAQELATTHQSLCFRCTWNRRKALFTVAERLGCNKLAFGHHADDIAETILMNLCYNGRVGRMEPKMALFGGALTVIRPLALVEERDITPFVAASGFPVQGEPCAQEAGSRRTLVRRVLRELERESLGVKRSLFAAVERHNQLLLASEPDAMLPNDLSKHRGFQTLAQQQKEDPHA
jgi:tRNA(Ile)-lysidine synthase TilS/MesJ